MTLARTRLLVAVFGGAVLAAVVAGLARGRWPQRRPA